MYHIVWVNITL